MVLPLLSRVLVLLFVYYLDVLAKYGYNALFVIVHVRCCPAAMVPVASCELEEDCVQSSEKEVVKPGVESADTVKEPDFSPTAWLFPLLIEKDDG